MSKQPSSIKNLDDYIGAFYEDTIQTKMRSSKNILELFQDVNNLEALLQHDALLPLLSRTLSENHKKSIDLSVYILSTFYILSNFKQFQDMLTENKIGATIIQILENQIQRFDLMYSQYIEMWRKNNENDRLTAKSQLKKLNILIWKQDKLFYVCLNILFNISSNPAIQKKMRKAGLVQILCRCLQRNDFHLLIITLIFIKKISLMAEYKEQLLGVGIIQKLQRFFSCQNDILLNFALLIFYNLSFDKGARSSIEKASLIPKLVHLMAQDSPNRMTALNILYLLSTDIGIRYTLAYTNCMDYVIKLILFPNPAINAVELFSLAINLAANQRNVQHISSQDFFKILDKSLKSQDPTMLKFCKSFLRSSKNEEIMSNMKGYLKDKLIKLIMTKSKNSEMCLQLLGIMSNSKIGTQWTDVLINNDKFLDFLQKTMLNGVTQDDILMEILALISNICKEAQCCNLIEKLLQPVLALFLRDEYDPQFISQVLYTIYCFIFHFVGLEYILNDGEVLMRILQLIEDPNEGVRQINDLVLTILRETDDVQLNENIKQSKFYQHNKRWLTETQGIHDWVYSNPYEYNQQMLDPRMWQSEDDYDE